MAIFGDFWSLTATVLGFSILYVSWSLHSLHVKSQKSWTQLPSIILATIKTKYDSLVYLFRGADMIHEGFLKSNGKPYVINTPSRKNLMVTSWQHIREINAAPNHVLSLHAVAKDFLQPKHTMHGFVWKNQRGIEGVGFVRALRTILTSNLPDLVESLNMCVEDQFKTELNKCKVKNGYRKAYILPVAERVVTRCNARVFFGPELSSNPVFLDAALSFPHDCFVAAEILRILPSAIAPFFAWCVTRKYRASTIMYDHLIEVVKERMNQDPSCASEKVSDGVQWLIDTSPKRENWTAERLVGEIMAIWYGSVHTLSIATTYALLDLYSHPEIIEPLRNEVRAAPLDDFVQHSQGLPLLDSFLRESARLSAFESTGIRREVLQPFTLSGGETLSPGDWICVPHRSMMRDNSFFDDALTFNAFRFVDSVSNAATCKNSRLTDSSDSWLVWGAGRILCPGRFYATVILKLIVAHIITEYDAVLVASKTPRSMQWRSAVIPKPNIALLLRRNMGL